MKCHFWLPTLRQITLALSLACATYAQAASLGAIQLSSGLGQPLRATVPLAGDGINDLGSACIKARLQQIDGTFIATPGIGLTHTAQKGVITFSTTQNMNEPVVTLLVETGCTATVYRNYQLLLDPVRISPIEGNTSGTRSEKMPSNLARQPALIAIPIKTQRNTDNYTTESSRKRDQASVQKSAPEQVSTTQSLPTFAKEMSLPPPSTSKKIKRSALLLSSDPEWISEDSITPTLKLTASLSEVGAPENVQKDEDFRAAQQRFSAIIAGADATNIAEAKMNNAQKQVLLLQADNERQKQQALAERAKQEAKKKASFSFAWFIGLGALLVVVIATSIWLFAKLTRKRKSPAKPAWKNYHAASDTLIADLSTQTLFESEFLPTGGDTYNTTDFVDSQFGQDTIFQEDFVDEPFEEIDFSQAAAPQPPVKSPDQPPAPQTKHEAPVENKVQPVHAPGFHVEPTKNITAKGSQATVTNNLAPLPISSPTPVAQAVTTTTKQQEPKHDALPASKPTTEKDAVSAVVPRAPVKARNVALTLKVEEIADVMQQAEFWMLLQDPFRAIEILEPYRDVAHPESPVPWIYLLDLYRMVGDKKKYEALLVRIEAIFNAKIPRWDGQFGITPRSLNDFPHVVEKICDLWESEEIVSYLESLLIDKRDGEREGFDLPVYRNIVQLITLAREPEKSQQHEQLRFGKAQAILFSQQTPKLDHVAAPNNEMQKETNRAIDSAPQTAAKIKSTGATFITSPPPLASPIKETTVDVHQSTQATVIQSALAANIDTVATMADSQAFLEPASPEDLDDDASMMETKLELALAYQEIGEKDGARELLYEVIKGGAPAQSEKAKSILAGIA